MKINNFINKHIFLFSIVLTLTMVFIVDSFKVPNPNVILLTSIVYLTFLGGFISGTLSGLIVVIYSMYFFSLPNQLFCFSPENFQKVIVITIFVPIMILIVGTLKRGYVLKTRELELTNEKLELLSKIDPLTGIANRRYFDEVFLKEINRASYEKSPLSLLLIDIDFFKKYNDYYGHVSGDNCLKMVVEAITKELQRPMDLLARFGGEEFIVLLPNTDRTGAEVIGTKIVDSVSSLKIPHCTSSICPYITVSVGITTIIDPEICSSTNFIDQADKALYIAKKNGRNRAIVFS